MRVVRSRWSVVSKSIFRLAFCAFLFALCVPAVAQQAKKIPRIGYISGSGSANNPGPYTDAFRQGLRELGYIEGKNILVNYRYIEGRTDRAASLVTEFLKLKVDVLVVTKPPTIRAAKQMTETIPVIMVISDDPVSTGIISSLAHPGGNITGITRITRELSGKRLELLQEVVPQLSRVGVLWGTTSGRRDNFHGYDRAARGLKIEAQSLEVRGPNPDLDRAFQAAAKGHVNAIAIVRTALLTPHAERIADLAKKYRLPSILESDDFVEAGGLMSYSAIEADQYKRAAVYVDKILKGAKPADLPVEQPTKFELVINLKTAKQIGLTIPQSVLLRADKVIR